MSFNRFVDKLAASEAFRPITANSLATMHDQLPPPLLTFLKQYGSRSFGHGLIWFVDPMDYVEILEEWRNPPKGHVVFARNAFADLFSVCEGSVYFLMSQYQEVQFICDNIEDFGEVTLYFDETIKDFLFIEIFEEARVKFGEIAENQCYAFTPALMLGGDGSVDSLKIADISVYLDILSQCHA